jgi:hypothetical protein
VITWSIYSGKENMTYGYKIDLQPFMKPSLRVNDGPGEPTDRDTRRLIGYISALNQYESQIPLCKTIDEVEEIRGFSQGVQSYARECGEIGPTLVTWAKRCAMLCQLRITEIQMEQKARQEAKAKGESYTPPKNETNGEVPPAWNFTSPQRRSDANLLNSLPKEELEKHMESSQSISKIADKVRKERGPKKPKSTPDQLEKARARYHKRKARKAALNDSPAPQKRDICHLFKIYWNKEKELLFQCFNTTDFGKLESRWIEAFRKLQQDVEQSRQERSNALAKLKTKTPSDVVGAVSR